MTASAPTPFGRLRRAALALAVGVLPLGGTSAAGAAETYRLQAQDRVRIHVSEWPTLSGEATVDSSGNVTLPVVGEVPAADLTTGEFGRRVAESLQNKAALQALPDASVVIVAYRPFYILGHVSAPGEYSWRPGMVVLNAMSIAGGVYRRPDGGGRWAVRQAATDAQGRIAALSARASDLRAERARLQAELDDRVFEPEAGASPADAAALSEQRALYEARAAENAARIASLEEAVEGAARQRDALSEQTAAVDRRLDKAQADLSRVQPLAKRSLAPDRLFQLDRTVADVQAEQRASRLALLRAEDELATAQRALAQSQAGRRGSLLDAVQRNEAEARQVEAERRSLSDLLDDAATESAEIASQTRGSEEPQLTYSIVRANPDGTLDETPVAETDRVEPGDILKVTVADPQIVGAVADPADR